MRPRVAATLAIAGATAGVAWLSLQPSSPGPNGSRGAPHADRAVFSATRFSGVREDCSSRSEASFPGAFSDSRNLVVGPLVLIGGAFTDAVTVREYGGNKFPLLVTAGHAVTVRIGAAARRTAGLAYGPLPQGREITWRDAHRSVMFVACRPGKAPRRYSPNGPSGSDADGVSVTFWSGFVLARRPACVPLEVYVDEAAAPRRVGLPLGRTCHRPAQRSQ